MPQATSELVRCARDARGLVFEPIGVEAIAGQRNVHVALTEPGGIRGNHLHQHATEITVVLGPALVRLEAADLETADAWQLKLAGPWVLAQRDGAAAVPLWRTVTRRAPTAAEMSALKFAWEVAAAARSNAIVLARGAALVGLGSGQTSRVDAVDVALMKARRANHTIAGTVLASDGFFPFADGVTHAAEAGVTAIVQPGGSVKDAEVIAEADRLGIAMVFTERRVFRH